MKKGQVSIIEGILVFVFISSVFYLLSAPIFFPDIDETSSVDSLLNSLSINPEFRGLVLNENLEVQELSQDWTSMFEIIENIFPNYELNIRNENNSKILNSCSSSLYAKYYFESIISISSNENFEFRIVTLGVCL